MRFAIPFVSLLAASAFAAPIAVPIAASEDFSASNSLVSASAELATANFLANSDVIIEKRGVFSIISSIFGGSSGISSLANSAISALGSKFGWSSNAISIIQTVTDDVITIGMNVAGMFLKKRDLDCPYDTTTKTASFNYSNSTTSAVESTTSTADSTSASGCYE
ncbi:unnamed protein product [Ambrosiozyma monospora]|uniref:Unnamed protein product n=1 Tax=Ambrosiozyma monospora TaxID=43982 RepID=A0ACB5U795_AMBMO|nr:unnamed protein product [Ambrosiozyma monospora]